MEKLANILIVSLCPYFLEKENVWFQENLKTVLNCLKTQAFWQDNILFLEKNQKISLSEVLKKIDELGYEKVFKVRTLGEFSQIGGVIDIFPINSAFALRLDFLGNTIENIEKLPLAIENEMQGKEILKKSLKQQKFFSDLKNLKPGEYLTHLDHGIGKFIGMEKKEINLEGAERLAGKSKALGAFYALEYAAGDKLYVPVGLERKLTRYIGFTEPKLSRLGGAFWQKTKSKIKEETKKFAKELLAMFAQKEISQRPAYEKQELFEAVSQTFPYKLTQDQARAIEEARDDLSKTKPMDRLVCGDVGFGKTEIALRAAVLAAENGRQVALIAPTAILANQHLQNFQKRLADFPLKIAALTRLQNNREKTKTIAEIKNHEIDIVIGTHAVLAKRVEFKNLGLLIIDDEQKFGVSHKEKLRQQNPALDILYLSATPIPRTIYLALSSLKQVSFVLTPPEGRRAIKTFVLAFDKEQIKKAITQELAKKGQIYFLHNRIETMANVKAYLDELKTTAKIAILHSKLSEKEITQIMADFQNKKIDVLLSTTIIENGLDIANANTLIVNDATRLGLSQAYQLRGRIGRSKEQAFAYFFYPKGKLRGLAKQRLAALKNAQELGSGYKIAMQDMEIRGAGNILGKEQSGSVNKVGLNLYCQMLSMAVDKLRQTSTLSELNEARHKNTRPENN